MRFTIRYNNFSSFMDNGGWILIPFLFVGILFLAFRIVSRWIFFKKCGEEGWKALIPIYTDITLIKISGINWWWILFLYISVFQSMISFVVTQVNVPYLTIISFMVSILGLASLFAKFNIGYNICKKFNISFGYAFLIALFEPIGLIILGVSKMYNYDKDIEVSSNGVFKTSSYNTGNSNNGLNEEFCEKCGCKIDVGAIYCGNCGNKVK